jgi:hypothetical protein
MPLKDPERPIHFGRRGYTVSGRALNEPQPKASPPPPPPPPADELVQPAIRTSTKKTKRTPKVKLTK